MDDANVRADNERVLRLEVLLELSQRIGLSQDMHAMLRQFVGFFVRRTSAGGAAVLACDREDCPVVHAAPAAIGRSQVWKDMMCQLRSMAPQSGDIWRARSEALVFYGFPLAHFGWLLMGRAWPLPEDFLRDLAGVAEHLGRACLACRDYEQHVVAEARLRRQATHDPLTGLPNRDALAAHMAEAIARAARHEKLLAVALLDLDDFKPVNDTHGHAMGDVLLQEVGRRLEDRLRGTDLVARLGGDEFVLVFEDLAHVDDLEAALARVGEAIHAPFVLPNGASVSVGCSAGVTIYPLDEADPDGLLRHADQALYAVKTKKTGRERYWQCFHPGELVSSRRLREQLARDAVAYFQPVLSLREGRLIGVEALARIRDGERVLAPAEFLYLLGRGERCELSLLMLGQGLALLKRLDDAGVELELDLAVNMEPEALVDRAFLGRFLELLAQAGMPPRRVVLEILEDGDFLSLPAARECLGTLKAAGVRIALDDVGSAYSSLLRLKELPVDKIKLDQGFVRDLHESPGNLVFVQSIQSLARGLDAQLVVEGVETEAILDAMVALDVEAVQGYAIARPMPAADMAAWVEAWRPPALLGARHPTSLLGAYAAHLQRRALTDGCYLENLRGGALPLPPLPDGALMRYLEARGWGETPIAQAHRRIAALLDAPPAGRSWEALAAAERELAQLVEDGLRSGELA